MIAVDHHSFAGNFSLNPTSLAAAEMLTEQYPNDDLVYDHLAFRTLGVPGLGIDSLAPTFLELGWRARDELRFPAKKLRARWFAPPCPSLPRIFISELLVGEVDAAAREAIAATLGATPRTLLARHSLLAAAGGGTPWPAPSRAQYAAVAAKSEYGAWVLANGAALNHTTLSVHAMRDVAGLDDLIGRLQGAGFALNAEGGAVKVSPDGLLRQASTRADARLFSFSCGASALVPTSYIEFAERLVLPEFQGLAEDQVQEHHRREGFEVGNADKIFESTYSSKAA
ncbi:hypothetical protein APUTEX25_001379 [Auxenochlorella protothecoides]|uniref:2-oxoadipate dioxygenase/decarboxylase n=1 Tax=Auxenochlorella protothecoides TaxID=3075 RepID=A0A3M7L4Q7_AUXPR|nr:hypothetical protein APUTEX25_001379 [Auxenochlorella protothecoides]|eukprot:RMZ56532.1 hypothetical protein APUTEX25_001379 [Auxenochlorella protothecoides]